ncbi:tyrosine-type recombinase/integrase [Vibrio cyclitrophicus]
MAKIQKIQKKTGIRYRVEYMRDGFRVSKTFQTKKEAEKFSATITLDDDLALGLANYTNKTMTFDQAVEEFKNHYHKKDLSMFQRLAFWSERVGTLPIGRINRVHVKDGMKALTGAGKANSTTNRYKSAISSLFEFVKSEYDTNHNPARQVKQLTEPRPVDRYATEEEIQSLMNAARESQWDRLYLLVLMAVSTGARRGELLGLTWQDIDFKAYTAYLDDTKNGDRRVLPLTEDCIEELQKFRGIGKNWVFPHNEAEWLQFKNFDCHWVEAKEKAGIKSLRFHDLRHTTGSWLAMRGVTTTAIQQILGHKTIQTTQRYVHHSVENKATILNDVFKKVGKK